MEVEIELPSKLEEQLEKLSILLGIPKGKLIEAMLREYVEACEAGEEPLLI